MEDKIYFYDHCDGDCDLGHAEYTCPKCGSLNEDFGDLWFKHLLLDVNRILVDSCCKCCCGLVARCNRDGWVIRQIE